MGDGSASDRAAHSGAITPLLTGPTSLTARARITRSTAGGSALDSALVGAQNGAVSSQEVPRMPVSRPVLFGCVGALLGFAVLLCAGGGALVWWAWPRPPAPAQAHTPDLAEVEKLVVTYTNEFRQQQGRRPLAVNDKLSKAARYYAGYLARTDRFSHTADGKQPSERATQHGYAWSAVAENIGWAYNSDGFTTQELARELFEGWKNSPGHRRNLLGPAVTEIGVAVAYGKWSGRYYGVQELGRPKSMAVSFRAPTRSDVEVRYTADGKAPTPAFHRNVGLASYLPALPASTPARVGRRCLKCGGAAAGGVTACLCGSWGASSGDCVICGGAVGPPPEARWPRPPEVSPAECVRRCQGT